MADLPRVVVEDGLMDSAQGGDHLLLLVLNESLLADNKTIGKTRRWSVNILLQKFFLITKLSFFPWSPRIDRDKNWQKPSVRLSCSLIILDFIHGPSSESRQHARYQTKGLVSITEVPSYRSNWVTTETIPTALSRHFTLTHQHWGRPQKIFPLRIFEVMERPSWVFSF